MALADHIVRWVCETVGIRGTHEDEMTVLYKTKSLDGTKPTSNPKTKPKANHNLIPILILN